MKLKLLGKIGLIILTLIVATSMVAFAGCKDDPEPGPGPGPGPIDPPPDPDADITNPELFVAASIGGPETLDPAAAYDSASGEILQMVYETLIYYDGESTSEYVPVLATEWTVSDDGKTYRFHIRDGVTFHSGNPMTLEDVEYSFERQLVQDYVGAPTWMFYEPLLGIGTSSHVGGELRPLSDLTSVVEIDGEWIQFNLAAPYEPFIQILCGWWGGIMEKAWCFV